MKIVTIIFLALSAVCRAETADEIARKLILGFAPFDNGLDSTSEGRRRTSLTNADFQLAHFMVSDSVPEGVRISYALGKLKEQKSGSVLKEAARTNSKDFAFEVDQSGDFVADEERTRMMRIDLAKKIEILEKRLIEIYHPYKAEQGNAGHPAKPGG